MLKQILILFFFSLICIKGFAYGYDATVYEQGSNHQKKLFTFKLTSKVVDGKDEHIGIFYDLDGKPVLTEDAFLEDYHILKTSIDQTQTGRKAVIEVKDGKVHFTKTNADGTSETSEEKLDDKFVVAANLQRFVAHYWSDLSSGKTLEFRFAVWERMETVGFRLKKVEEKTVNGEKAVVLKMTASSFVIRQLVDPILFSFSADGSKLLESNGRVSVKRKVGSEIKDLDADVTYTNYQP